MQENQAQQIVGIIEQAINSDVPKIYFNGFGNALGSGDVVIVLQCNNKPVAVLNASYTVTKTLAIKLAELISNLERETGNTIMTTFDVDSKLQERIGGEQK